MYAFFQQPQTLNTFWVRERNTHLRLETAYTVNQPHSIKACPDKERAKLHSVWPYQTGELYSCKACILHRVMANTSFLQKSHGVTICIASLATPLRILQRRVLQRKWGLKTNQSFSITLSPCYSQCCLTQLFKLVVHSVHRPQSSHPVFL